MKQICELNDRIVLGTEGLSAKAPRITARAIVRNQDGSYAVMYADKWKLHSLPGGGVEDGEDVRTALRREVYEETAVQIRIETDFRETVHYSPLPGVSKEVVYFLTETKQTEIKPREGEIAQVEWVPLEEAESSLTHENDKTVFRSAMRKLRRMQARKRKKERASSDSAK